jgi:hypothetical protein
MTSADGPVQYMARTSSPLRSAKNGSFAPTGLPGARLRIPGVVLGSLVRSIPFERSLLPLTDKPRSQAVQGTLIRPGAVRKLARLFHSSPVSRHAYARSFGQRWLPARPRAVRSSVRGRPARLLPQCFPAGSREAAAAGNAPLY